MRGPGHRFLYARLAFCLASLAVLCCASSSSAITALEITEVMFDPGNEDVWEWIEVRNTGGSAVNLHGAFAARLDDPNLPSSTLTFVDSNITSNTLIPAGGVAVLFDADLPGTTTADYLDQLFRNAWNLSPAAPLIGVRGFPALSNANLATSSIGFWENFSSYQSDLVPNGMGGKKVGSFTHSLFGIDYRSGFPVGNNKASIQWNGVGSNQSAANWLLSDPNAGASVSSAVRTPTADLGNPGVLPTGAPPVGLTITEVMYNPDANESLWEWIEVFNNTGADINFDPNDGSSYVFDDLTGTLLSSPNVTSGIIPNGTGAVLYNSSLSPAIIAGAWDPYASRDINFVPVSNFPLLSNGDSIGLWPSLTAYEGSEPGDARNLDNAAAALVYEAGGAWPPSTNGPSIYLESFEADPNQGGANWSLSQGDDAVGSYFASLSTSIHAGGDVGTPGFFQIPIVEDADFDNDNDVDGMDFLTWQITAGSAGGAAQGDANGDGNVDGADLEIWQTQYDFGPLQGVAAVPEPASAALVLVLLGFAHLGTARRRSPR